MRRIRLPRRVGKLECLEIVASLLDPPDPFEGLEVDPESASGIDFRNEKDIGHGDRSSDAIAVVANELLDSP